MEWASILAPGSKQRSVEANIISALLGGWIVL